MHIDCIVAIVVALLLADAFEFVRRLSEEQGKSQRDPFQKNDGTHKQNDAKKIDVCCTNDWRCFELSERQIHTRLHFV